MTVDKPPLALWVEALSAKLFGFNSLAILVPQALMGVASVGLLYDLTRRRWGRVAGTVAGLALALTPVIVAISRHNNPDALLVLCSVGALWCFVRALDAERVRSNPRIARESANAPRSTGATKWLVAAAVCVGLGFEAKMGAALMVVPGMALAWLWVAPRGRLVAIRQLAIAGAALLAVALAWPVLVWLTPAANRPWISGTSDNSIWSLIWEYNGFGRLEGQTGGPGSSGDERHLRRRDRPVPSPERSPRRPGGLAARRRARRRPRHRGALAPAPHRRPHRLDHRRRRRLRHHGGRLQLRRRHLPPVLHVPAGALRRRPGRRDRGTGARGGAGGWPRRGHLASRRRGRDRPRRDRRAGRHQQQRLGPRLARRPLGGGVGRARAGPLVRPDERLRQAALLCGVAVLLVGPAIWSVDTLGHPTSSTFPAGGPESASSVGGSGAGPASRGRSSFDQHGRSNDERSRRTLRRRRRRPAVDGRWRRRSDVRRRRPRLGPRIHRSARGRDDRRRQPVRGVQPRSSKTAPKWPGSAASRAKSPRSASNGSKNGSNPARSPGSTRAARQYRLRRDRRPWRWPVLRWRRRRLPHRLGIGDRHRGQVLHQGRLLRSTNPANESSGTGHALPMQRFVT